MFSVFTRFYPSSGSKKSPDTTSTTSAPPSAVPEPGEEDVFYVVDHLGNFRPASPMSRQSSTDLDIVDVSEVMDNGAFVYIENDTTALVFDGMEVRELHFSELPIPPKGDVAGLHSSDDSAVNVTRSPSEPGTPVEEDPSANAHADDFDSSSTLSPRQPVDVIPSTDQPPTPSIDTTFTSSAPSTFPAEPLRPEVQEFLSRIRANAFGAGAATRMGGIRMLPLTSPAMLYSTLWAKGIVTPVNGLPLPPSAWMPSVVTRNSNQFDDSYYTRAPDGDSIDEGNFDNPTSTDPSSPPTREPHLFYMRRQGIEPTKNPHSVPLL